MVDSRTLLLPIVSLNTPKLGQVVKKVSIEIARIKPTGPHSFRVWYKINNIFFETDEESLFQEFLSERGSSLQEFHSSNSCTKDILMFHFRTWVFEKKQKNEKEEVTK